MADSNENILVEFDYNNITIIDPNKVIDENGKAKERYVKQENLVMYANLETKVIPRSKLAIGVAANDTIQTVSVADINFLKPGGKDYMEENYTNELTGKDSLIGKADNQPTQTNVTNPNKPNDYFIRQTLSTGGKPGAKDNGFLGITSINIKQGTDFMPVITVELVDIKGKALFEGADNSPYAAFFNLPYPMFYLTLKGYFGKAVRLPLMLQNFTSRFDTSSSNFFITLTFYTYKYTMLSEMNMGQLQATPYMYKSLLNITPTQSSNAKYTETKGEISSIGYQKIKEVYSEYKSKGLISDDFPEIPLQTLQNRIEKFVENILDSFIKQNMDPITFIEEYQKYLQDYQKKVYYAKATSWFEVYVDKQNFYVLNDNKQKIYQFKPVIKTLQDKENAINELNAIIFEYNEKLKNNQTLGQNPGTYTINGKTKSSSIPNPLSLYSVLIKNEINLDTDINLEITYQQRNNAKKIPTELDLLNLKSEISKNKLSQITLQTNPITQEKEIVNTQFYFWFEGNPKSFLNQTNELGKSVKVLRDQVEQELTDALNSLLQSKASGIGFIPTIRNVLAVVFANTEGFIRLMDDVHRDAWEKRKNEDRIKSIYDKSTSNASPDTLDSGLNQEVIVYPWPQFLVSTPGENGQEKFEVRYPGEQDVIDFTKGYNYDVWPEIEFVEEFIRGFTQRTSPPTGTGADFNEVTDSLRVSLNSIEFPVPNAVYSNKEEIKFFFEIYERVLLSTFYSKLSRVAGQKSDGIINTMIATTETSNLVQSLSNDNPYIIKKLKEYNFNGNNFLEILRNFSNQGQGESWQNYIRGVFNTPYLRNITQNSTFEILSSQILDNTKSQPLIPILGEEKLIDYIKNSTKSNYIDFTDIYPFTNLKWFKRNMASSEFVNNIGSVMDTRDILVFNTNKKVISNFTTGQSDDEKRPFSNFNHLTGSLPSYNSVISSTTLKTLFDLRTHTNQVVTEGDVFYSNYSGQVSFHQTTSMFNTPFFINSIQNGVQNYKTFGAYPYVQAAYLFLNSLPLSTLREKYKTYSNSTTTDLSYIFATLKKFGAVHQVPYSWVLKIGSVWHRYKTYLETGNDILTTAWSGFNYTYNFDPINNNPSTTYSVILNNASYDIVLQQNTTIAGDTLTTINTGFYPKLINDFNVFYQGFEIFTGYTNTDIQSGVSTNVSINLVPSSQIVQPKKFDKSNPNRLLQVTPWSVLLTTDDSQFQYVMPSHGSSINQTFYECFKGNNDAITEVSKIKTELLNNQSMYDGSVRLFWGAPNYGYFDSSKIVKSQPDEYFKLVVSGDNQENFSFRSSQNQYTKISEMFSVFEKDALDVMENEFLKFSKTVYDFDDTLAIPSNQVKPDGEDKTLTQRIYQNFQALMRNLMILPKTTELTPFTLVESVTDNQFKNVQSWLKGFLNYNVVLKVGNPSSFNRRLFYSFSNKFFVDSIEWEKYTVVTPKALPYNGGNITLQSSKNTYSNEWKTLELYVGFSEIPELIYSDNGSYITDFFIDMNVAFTEQNIKDFSPIIKIYATQKLKQFALSPIPPIQPNPNQPEQLVATANLQDGSVAQILKGPSIKRRVVLKNTAQETFFVGTPTLSLLTTNRELIVQTLNEFYGNFLINPIVGNLVENPQPSYPPVPNAQTKFGYNKFVNTMDEYLTENENIQIEIFNQLFGQLRKDLPNVSIVPEGTSQGDLQGLPAKVELWDSFKSLNDKWISGNDFKTKTLFEDVLLFDRASRDIGNKIIVDVIKLKNRLKNISPKMSALAFIQSIITENNFVIYNLPSYVNFYNVQDIVKNAKPKPEGTLEFANTLFGTFLNVDYRNSSSKMICQYGGKPSSVLDLNNNVDFRYRNDAFDLRRASDNPLVENLDNKNDWGQSNKVVGFNVDIGPQNQSIFTSFSVSQEQGLATAESLEILNQMANQSGGRKASSQSVSLFNVYKNRSYTCSIEMMGNAMIQPTMYFNLRYVPMFSGPYMITNVSHNIKPGTFMTYITGIRQPTASLPKVDSYIQSLRTTLLENVKTLIKQERQKQTTSQGTNKITQAANTAAQATSKTETSANQSCTTNGEYSTYTPELNPQVTKLDVTSMKTNIKLRVNDSDVFGSTTDKDKLKVAIFVACYLFSYRENELSFVSNSYNFTGIDLTQKWAGSIKQFIDTKYYCASNSTSTLPYAQFTDVSANVKFLAKLWDQRMFSVEITKESMTKFWIANRKATNLQGQNLTNEITQLQNSGEYSKILDKVDTAIKLYNRSGG